LLGQPLPKIKSREKFDVTHVKNTITDIIYEQSIADVINNLIDIV